VHTRGEARVGRQRREVAPRLRRRLPLDELDEQLLEPLAGSGFDDVAGGGAVELVVPPAADVDGRAVGEEQRLDLALVLGPVPVVADRVGGTIGARGLPADREQQLLRGGRAVGLEVVAVVVGRKQAEVVHERGDVQHLAVERP
jgi:hypothetical protein